MANLINVNRIINWGVKLFTINNIVLGVFTVGVLFLLVFFAYLIENLTKKSGNFHEVSSWIIWVVLLGICMVFLQRAFDIVSVNGGTGWVYSNLQLAVLFYCLYVIRNKGIIIFNLLTPVVAYGSQINNLATSKQILILGCYFILAGTILIIGRYGAFLIDTGLRYWVSVVLFAVNWWVIIWAVYQFKGSIMIVRVADFIVAMGIIHFFNRFVRRILQQYVGLKHDVQFDELTGARNRASFDQIAREVYQIYRKESVPLSMVMFDIDSFKKFNDTYGHSVGDEVLKKVVKHFQTELFQKRTGGEIFRIGGEEFFVILRGYTSREAQKVITDIGNSLVDEPITVGSEKVRITISCGIATINHNDTTFGGLYERLDSYLYVSKNSGKDRMTVEGNVREFSQLNDNIVRS